MIHPNGADDGSSARRAAREQWTRHPAGTTLVAAEDLTPEFYAQMTATRYAAQPWHKDLLRRFAPKGRLLEIGSGAGTDHAQLATMVECSAAIDLAHRGALLTNQRLRLEGRRGQGFVADGESLPFRDHAFDCVYSFGVIHVTDHPEVVVDEIWRVLVPGGRFLVAVYNRASAFAAWYAGRYVRTGAWRNESWRDYLARCEAGAEELDDRPLIRLYSRRGAERLFARFAGVRSEILHLGAPLPVPQPVLSWLDRRIGWYVVVTGYKPPEE